jgi:hypothetical protein
VSRFNTDTFTEVGVRRDGHTERVVNVHVGFSICGIEKNAMKEVNEKGGLDHT